MNDAIKYYFEPHLTNPNLIAAWPGIGNIGIVAVNNLRESLEAEAFAEIEPWRFSYPHSISIKNGELRSLQFPESKFFFKNTPSGDAIIFIGGEQPADVMKGYEMTNLVMDVAMKHGCQRVYTAAAAVAPIHHTVRPKVWAVPNRKELLAEVKTYPNTLLMGEVEGRSSQGTITGLNGLLLGVAKDRGLPGICLLGEIPVYIAQFPVPYPRASKSILEVLVSRLGLTLDLSKLDTQAKEVEQNIERLYHLIPEEIRQRIDKLREVSEVKEEQPTGITEEDAKRIMQQVEDFFRKGGKQD